MLSYHDLVRESPPRGILRPGSVSNTKVMWRVGPRIENEGIPYSALLHSPTHPFGDILDGASECSETESIVTEGACVKGEDEFESLLGSCSEMDSVSSVNGPVMLI